MSHLYLRKSMPIHLEWKDGKIKGYASTYDVDHANDRIMPGAFKKSLSQWEQKARWPLLYLEHDPEDPIGFFHEVTEDTKGLFVLGKLLLELESAKKAQKAIMRGKTGLSIGFYVFKSHKQRGIRYISELGLKEISLVSDPCNPQAQIEPVDSMKDLARAFRDLKQTLSS